MEGGLMDLINILFAKALSNGNTDKEYVDEAIKALKGEVSADLDTLEELSKALGNDPDFFLSVKNELDKKITQEELNSAIANLVSISNYNPIDKTDSMTQPIGKDGDGKLWTAPGAVQTVNGEAPDESGNVQVSGLPDGAEANMQLVTDADGAAKWEEKLAYEEIVYKTLLEETVTPRDDGGVYIAVFHGLLALETGKTYTVNFDGTEYTCVAYEHPDFAGIHIGNISITGINMDNSGEPFFITSTDNKFTMLMVPSGGTYTVKISGNANVLHKIPFKYIGLEIESDSIAISILKELRNQQTSMFLWKGYLFSGGSDIIVNSDNVMLQTVDGIFSEFPITDGAINLSNVKSSYYDAKALQVNKAISQPFMRFDNAIGNIEIYQTRVITGVATTNKRFIVDCDGTKNYKTFSVLGNGTVEAYALILPSTTPGSTKNYKITVDDSGTISATEITG